MSSVVTVDNASSDGSAAVAREAGADAVIENTENLGFARAVNQGLQHGKAPQILLLNPDARVRAAELAALSATLAGSDGAVVVAPLLRDERGIVQAGAGRFATVNRRVGLCLPLVGRAPRFAPQYLLSPAELASPQPRDVDYVYGAAMLIERAFLTGAGGLDERFFLFAEDEDICRQAARAGLRVLLDTGVVALHEGGGSYTDAVSIEAQRLFSTYRLLHKWRGAAVARAYHTGVAAAFRLRGFAASATPGRDEGSIDGVLAAFSEAVMSGLDPLLDRARAPQTR